MINVPEPKKHNNVATNQHLIPRTYLKKWKHNKGKKDRIWLYDKENQLPLGVAEGKWLLKSCETCEVMYKNGFYDIKAGSLYMPEEAIKEIYADILQLDIELDDKKLDSLELLNKYYYRIDEWVIKDEIGEKITQDELDQVKKYFMESRWTYLETEWAHKFENGWSKFIELLEKNIRQSYKNNRNINIIKDDLVLLVKYCMIYNWRSIAGNEMFNRIYSDMPIRDILEMIEIPEGERTYEEDITAYDQMKHASLLNGFVDYLMYDKGKIKANEEAFLKHLAPVFLISEPNDPFITSDVPVFTRVREDGLKEMVFIATPTLAIVFGRGILDEFIVKRLSTREVLKYNRAVAEYGNQLVFKNKDYDVSNLFVV